MDLMMNALRGRVSSDFDDLVHRTDSPFTTSVNSFPCPTKVLHAANRKLRWSQGPSRSLGILQDLDAPSRSGRRDYMQGFPYHAKRARENLVQQVDA